MEQDTNQLELATLVSIFYKGPADLGAFAPVSPRDVAEPERSLLNHDCHMTVTLEKFHSSPVHVVVLRTARDGNHYAREILLRRSSDGAIVQYGVARLDLDFMDEHVVSEIESEQTPLGRILINHNVMRQVELLTLYRIRPAAALSAALQIPRDAVAYGRTALIHCNSQPAVELLEIVR
jgi:chorismate-pyruvate lyase